MNADTQKQAGGAVVFSDGFGRWFYAEFGYEVVVGRCVARTRSGGYILCFRWGGPFRTRHLVAAYQILGEAEDPRWLSKLWRLVKRLNRGGAQ